MSFDRYSRDDVIGEVVCPLSSVENLHLTQTQNISLCREICPRSLKIQSQGRGELLVSLCWQPAASKLTVVVLKARNLPKMDVTGLADPYVKIYLLYNGQRIAKRKTHVKKRTLNPIFNESIVFEIPNSGEGLGKISLEFALLDWDRVTKNEVIGRLEIGGPKCQGSTLNHWNEVCNSPKRQIADWHKLREMHEITAIFDIDLTSPRAGTPTQPSVDVTLSIENERDKAELEISEKAHRNNNNNNNNNNNGISNGIVDCVDASRDSLGKLVFKLHYLSEQNGLVVTVVQCKNLPARGQHSSDPYVKLQLLPDKQHRTKTRVVRNTRDPIYDEDFTFFGLSFAQLQV
ncbi:synaptotagmin-4-like [Copidosoma floridanum]|uniref:synaptotagmin-4-like n=1 Tax=Copidosoma floridanum TaxID=29053 RepID=UPI0006C94632|nr:synaptotagmin-4-like [Copidosoma floridanum]